MQHPARPRPPPLLPAGVQGTFQLSVQQDGPAERAGVPAGSWLLELNGASVRSYSRTQLARKVRAPGAGGWGSGASKVTEHPAFPTQLKQSGSKVTLLVASSAVEEFYRQRGLQVTAALADTSWLPFKVRELHMVKGPEGYGFLLKEDDCSSGATGEWARGAQFACLRAGNICNPMPTAGSCPHLHPGASSASPPPAERLCEHLPTLPLPCCDRPVPVGRGCRAASRAGRDEGRGPSPGCEW